MKKTSILISVLVAAIICGIVWELVLWSKKDDFAKTVSITKNGVTTQKLDFSANGLNPGDSREYTLTLRSREATTYAVSFTFKEKKDGGLRDHINVTISRGEEYATFSLSELFEGEPLTFTCDITMATPARFRIVFSMPETVGNEAQGTTTDFTAVLSAEEVRER